MVEMNLKLYTLRNRQVVEATMEEWFRDLSKPDRFVGQWTFDDVYVSTVFLGINHRWFGDGPPLVFETMVFGGPMDRHMERTSTWAEAEQTHERVCRDVTRTVT